MPTLFRLINIRAGETMAIVELPDDCMTGHDGNPSLLEDVVADNMSLKVQYGADYTLDPIDSPMGVALRDLYNALQVLTKEPSRYIAELSAKQDRVISYVERLFDTKLQRIVLNTKEDVANYVAFLRGKAPNNYQIPLTYRKVLGEFGDFLPEDPRPEDPNPEGEADAL